MDVNDAVALTGLGGALLASACVVYVLVWFRYKNAVEERKRAQVFMDSAVDHYRKTCEVNRKWTDDLESREVQRG